MSVNDHALHIFNETSVRIPRKKIIAIYDDILRHKENLNVVFIGDEFSKEMNNRHRGKDTPANVLSFPSYPSETNATTPVMTPAEIYINVDMAMREGGGVRAKFVQRVLFLCIHGMLHIDGYSHSNAMDEAENMYATKYI